jgi:hypothetical protein
MATSAPTPITPPRVPLIDPRTGLIDRAWYMFFLSLFQTAETVAESGIGPDAVSLAASLEAALQQATQSLQTQPVSVVEQMQPLLDAIAMRLDTLPRQELGTMAALQQANVPWLTFDATPQSVPTDVGTVAWDGGTTLNIQMTTNVLQRVGETEFVYVKASAAITKGELCYHTGSVGSSGVITAAPTPIGLADPNQIVGVAAESIALNGFGLIQISGDLRGFNTTGSSVGEVWADGDPLYYNPAYVGSMTKVKPSAPNQKTYIGEVISAGSGGSGSMHIRIVQGSVLGGTDSNVQFSALVDKNLVQYDAVAGYWKNVAPTAISIGTATNLEGGAGGSIPYQSALDTTTFLSIGVAGRWLGSSGSAPQWNAPAALTKTDDTNVTLTLGGSASTALLNAASLTLGWTGQLSVARGGTGLSSFTANRVFYAASTSTIGSSANLTFDGSTLATSAFTATGNVSLNGGIFVFNDAGADLDARFEGDTDANLLFLDAGNDRVGIGLNNPTSKLHLGNNLTTSNTIPFQIGYAADFFGYRLINTNNPASTAAGTFAIQRGTSSAWADILTSDDNGNVAVGGGALATTATDGFLYVPTCAGTPTGTPTAITGMAPIVVNTTNNKLYFYSGGAWRDAGP